MSGSRFGRYADEHRSDLKLSRPASAFICIAAESGSAHLRFLCPSPRVLLWALCVLCGSTPIQPAAAQTAWPRIESVRPPGGQRGTTVEVTVSGLNVGRATGLIFDGGGIEVESVTPEPPPMPAKEGEKPKEPEKNKTGKVVTKIRIAPDARPGPRAMRVLTPVGPSDVGWFDVGLWPETVEREPNNSIVQAQAVSFPTTVNGRLEPGEDADVFRFHAGPGQTLIFEVTADRIGSALDSILSVQDGDGRELALNEDFNERDSLLAFSAPADGDYFLLVRDLRNEGGGNHFYRLAMGAIPYVTAVFPAGGRAGETVPMALCGFNLGPEPAARVTLPSDPGLAPMSLSLASGASNPITVAVGDPPEIVEAEPNDAVAQAQLVSLPVTANGRILPSGAGNASIPDTDCYRFRAEKGQTIVLEVAARRLGSRLDSVLAVLDAGGKELATNDDSLGKDSSLEFTAPEAGDYIARITDLQERGGTEYPYRLSIAVAVPDFRLSFTPERLAVGRGGRTPLTVTAERLHGFEGEIAIEVAGLPPGVGILGSKRIAPGRTKTSLVLTAPADAALAASPFRVEGIATIEGRSVRRPAQGLEEIVENDERRTRPSVLSTAGVAETPDVILSLDSDKVSLAPGGKVEIPVKIARKSGFTARVPLTALDLPPGVRVEESQIEENKTDGKLTLRAEGNAVAVESEIVIVGNVVLEGNRQVPHASAPIGLAVKPGP